MRIFELGFSIWVFVGRMGVVVVGDVEVVVVVVVEFRYCDG